TGTRTVVGHQDHHHSVSLPGRTLGRGYLLGSGDEGPIRRSGASLGSEYDGTKSAGAGVRVCSPADYGGRSPSSKSGALARGADLAAVLYVAASFQPVSARDHH